MYKYKDQKLVADIATEVMQKIFQIGTFTIKEIREQTKSYHLLNGGKAPTSSSEKSIYKKALQNLCSKNLCRHGGSRGYWVFGSNEDPIQAPESATEPVAILEIQTRIVPCIYVYYLPLYKMEKHLFGPESWRCKVGLTEGDPRSRIYDQSSTGLPEVPHIALVIRHSMAAVLEKAIHATLSLKGRRIDGVPGMEWFYTSPKEVFEIAKSINEEIVKGVSIQEEMK